jgi:hypothetical protein
VKGNQTAACLLLIAGLCTWGSGAAQGRAYLGMGLADEAGVEGTLVGVLAPEGPAAKAGVRLRDLIIAMNGARIENAQQLTLAVGALQAGDRLQLTLLRGQGAAAQRLVIAIVAEGRPAEAASPPASEPGAADASSLATRFETFEDPLEHAFHIQAPADWRTVGGLARRSALQFNAFLRSLSADQMTYLFIGEPTLLSFVPPSAWRAKLHYTEGSLFDSGLGGISMVLRPLSGQEFAKLYGQGALSGLCSALRFTASSERPDMAAAADKLVASAAPSVSSGGEARFSCTHHHESMQARVEVVTRATRDNVMWNVIFLKGFVAPARAAERTEALLTQIGSTFQFDPAWLQRQSHLDQEAASAINRRMQEFFRQEQSVIEKLNAVDESFSSMDEIVSGYSTYHDAATGNTYQLANTNPYKWIDNSTGRIFSTPTNVPPGFGGNLSPLSHLAQ